jgi:hypothetical protein
MVTHTLNRFERYRLPIRNAPFPLVLLIVLVLVLDRQDLNRKNLSLASFAPVVPERPLLASNGQSW